MPYEDELETAEIYGIEVLRRPGAKAHDWFAGVRPGEGTVKFILLPMHDAPGAARRRVAGPAASGTGASRLQVQPRRRRRSSTSWSSLVARGFEAYMETPPDGDRLSPSERSATALGVGRGLAEEALEVEDRAVAGRAAASP